MSEKKELTSMFADLLDPDKWKPMRPFRDPLMEYFAEENRKYHIELKKFYPDYEERNQSNPFDWSYDLKRGRPSLATLIGRDFYMFWHSDKVAKFGVNPFQEYDDLHKKLKTEGRTLVVKYNQTTYE